MEQNIEQQVTRGLGTQPTQTQKSFQFPTETISLPSKGLVYPESNPLAKGDYNQINDCKRRGHYYKSKFNS